LLLGAELVEQSAHSELLSMGKQYRAQRLNQTKVLVDDRRGIEVYHDLLSDPGEARPRKDMTPAASRLLQELRATQRSSAELYLEVVGASPAPTEMDEEIEERLRSLGYVGGADDP
jgi:hypothetical protein